MDLSTGYTRVNPTQRRQAPCDLVALSVVILVVVLPHHGVFDRVLVAWLGRAGYAGELDLRFGG